MPKDFPWGWILFSKHPLVALLCGVIIYCTSQFACAGQLAVIVNKANPVELTQEQLQHILLNKQKYFYAGSKIHLFHLPARSPELQLLCMQLLDLTAAQYQSYWSRLLFTGNADAQEYLEPAQMLQFIQQDPNALGYIPAELLTPEVRVVGYISDGGFSAQHHSTPKTQPAP